MSAPEGRWLAGVDVETPPDPAEVRTAVVSREECGRQIAAALAEGERQGRAAGKRAGLLLAIERLEAAACHERDGAMMHRLMKVACGLREMLPVEEKGAQK